VPLIVAVDELVLIPADKIPTPGAKMSTQAPIFEKVAS
jgi:hypothetical protein